MTHCCHAHHSAVSHSLPGPDNPAPRPHLPSLPAAPLPQPAALLTPATLLGEVCYEHDARHDGRVLIEFRDSNKQTARVMAEVAAGLCVAAGDRVLFVVPANAPLAVVTSVLARKGAAAGPTENRGVNGDVARAHASTGNQLVLRDSEALSIHSAAGQMLVAIERGACGPVVRLGQGALELDVPGELHLVADSMRLTSRRGPVQITSPEDDVVVKGRFIRLN